MNTSNNYDPNQLVTGYPVQPNVVTAPPAPIYYNPDLPQPQPQPQPNQIQNFLAIITLVITCVFIGYILFWEIGTPTPRFQVNSVSIPNFNTSSQSTVNWNVDFEVINPRKGRFFGVAIYDPVTVLAYFHKDYLSGAVIDHFVINGTSTTKSVTFATLGSILSNVLHRNSGGQNLGVGSLDFRLKGGMHFAHGGHVHTIKVHCKDVMLGFSPDTGVGSLAGAPKRCRVSVN